MTHNTASSCSEARTTRTRSIILHRCWCMLRGKVHLEARGSHTFSACPMSRGIHVDSQCPPCVWITVLRTLHPDHRLSLAPSLPPSLSRAEQQER